MRERPPEIAWAEYAMQTSHLLRQLLETDGDLFQVLAGATLALHQDVHMKFGLDMNRTDDVVWNAMMDRLQPNSLGTFPKRCRLVLDALNVIDNTHLDFIAAGTTGDEDPTTFQTQAMVARLKSTAARIWVITVMGKMDTSIGKRLALPAKTIWLMLASVDRATAAQEAVHFVGDYFDGIANTSINPSAWPELAD